MVERRKTIFACLYALALTITLALLGRVLLTSRSLSQAYEAEQVVSGDLFGMVLIDISDTEDTQFFHVDEPGVYVLVVRGKSAAEDAGVLAGDQIVALNDVAVESSAQANELLDSLGRASTLMLTFTLKRAGEGEPLRLTLPANEAEDESSRIRTRTAIDPVRIGGSL